MTTTPRSSFGSSPCGLTSKIAAAGNAAVVPRALWGFGHGAWLEGGAIVGARSFDDSSRASAFAIEPLS